MKYFLAILITAVTIFFLGIWQKWWKNPFSGVIIDNGDGTQTCPDGSVIPVAETCPSVGNGTGVEEAPPSGRSVLVNVSELTFAPKPTDPVGQSYMNDFFNKATLAPAAIAPAIHYVDHSSFTGAPHIYWWYKGGHYTFIKKDAGFTYYQESVLPNEIKLIVKTTDTCYPDWYLSGSKYALNGEQNIDSALKWCIYKKQ